MPDLETMETTELWEELRKRFRNCMLVVSAPGMEKDTNFSDVWWDGSHSEILGLIEYSRLVLAQHITADD